MNPTVLRSSLLAALLMATGACEEPTVVDGGDDEAVVGDAASEVDAEADRDGGEGGDGGVAAGPLTFVLDALTVSTERRCDFDGDGVADNAVADLGAVDSMIFAEYMGARMSAEGWSQRPYLVHLPWVEDLGTLTDPEVDAMFLVGRPPQRLALSGVEVPPEGPFVAAYQALDGCGEPRFHSDRASLDHGSFVWTGGTFFLPIAWDELVPAREPDVTGTIAPGGDHVEAEGCVYATIADLGAVSWEQTGSPLSALGALVAGGRAVGLPTVPGLEPDVDLDGDGVEGFQVDESGAIVSCVDGDSTVIAGADCWADPRMADAFAFSFSVEGGRSSLSGRTPAWDRSVGAPCAEGPPEESLFDSPAFDDVECAAFEEVCEPFAPQPCCEPGQVCTGANTVEYRCFRAGCEPPWCDYGGEPGLCRGLASGVYGCRSAWRVDNTGPPCEDLSEGCATEYGVSEETVCHVQTSVRGDEIHLCYERCVEAPSGCEPGYSCSPERFSEESVCTRPLLDE